MIHRLCERCFFGFAGDGRGLLGSTLQRRLERARRFLTGTGKAPIRKRKMAISKRALAEAVLVAAELRAVSEQGKFQNGVTRVGKEDEELSQEGKASGQYLAPVFDRTPQRRR